MSRMDEAIYTLKKYKETIKEEDGAASNPLKSTIGSSIGKKPRKWRSKPVTRSKGMPKKFKEKQFAPERDMKVKKGKNCDPCVLI